MVLTEAQGCNGKLTLRLSCRARAFWASTQFLDSSSSWAHLRASEAASSLSPVMDASSAAVRRDAVSPFLAKTLAASYGEAAPK